MRINTWKKVFALFILFALVPVDASPNYEEVEVMQTKQAQKVEVIPFARDSNTNYTNYSQQINTTINSTETNATNGTETKDLSFTTGFIESVIMIFFAEFGDRVTTLAVIPINCPLHYENQEQAHHLPPCNLNDDDNALSFGRVRYTPYLGAVFTMLFDRIYILFASCLLFIGFGVKLIYDAYHTNVNFSSRKVKTKIC